MESIPVCIENRRHPEKTKYITPQLEPILRVSYGCMLYQEQVMQIFRSLAGYSLGRADIVRRAMSKKKHSVMEKEREIFVYGLQNADGGVEVEGCTRRGIPVEAANRIFDEMSSFASYAFNKSHAAAYALVAYQTAWLKRHYPCEFMAALLSSVIDSSGKIAEYAAECAKQGIRLLPPSVNTGAERFTVEEGAVRFGLLAVKNLGQGLIQSILREREKNGSFASLYSFLKRTQGRDFNRRAAEALILCGALDDLGANRRAMLLALPAFLSELENDARRNVEGQLGFFDMAVAEGAPMAEPELPQAAEFSQEELLAREKETMGFYLSGHPLAKLEKVAARIQSAKIADLLDPANETGQGSYRDHQELSLLCVIVSVKKKITKSNATMAFVTVEDLTGQMEVLMFPTVLERFANLCAEGGAVLLSGRLSLQENKDAKLVCNTVEDMNGAAGEEEACAAKAPQIPASKKKHRRGVFLRFASRKDPRIAKAEKYLAIFEGALPLSYYYEDEARYARAGLRGVDWNPTLEHLLRELLGESNVAASE
jgi:DNA polymerase-3 subunit alpha